MTITGRFRVQVDLAQSLETPHARLILFGDLCYIIMIEGLVSKSALMLGNITPSHSRCSLTLTAITDLPYDANN